MFRSPVGTRGCSPPFPKASAASGSRPPTQSNTERLFAIWVIQPPFNADTFRMKTSPGQLLLPLVSAAVLMFTQPAIAGSDFSVKINNSQGAPALLQDCPVKAKASWIGGGPQYELGSIHWVSKRKLDIIKTVTVEIVFINAEGVRTPPRFIVRQNQLAPFSEAFGEEKMSLPITAVCTLAAAQMPDRSMWRAPWATATPTLP